MCVLARSIRILFFASCPLAAEPVNYSEHVLPIFESSCLNCHNPDKTRGGLDLSTYAGTLKGSSGGKIVEPGDTGSTLLAVVRQTAEPIMPPEGEALRSEPIGVLEAWIEGGLLQHSDSKPRVAQKPKFDASLESSPDARPEGPPPMPEFPLLEPPVVPARGTAVQAMAFSPWAPLLAATAPRQVLLFDTAAQRLAAILPFPEGEPVSLAFTPNARYLIVGGGIAGKSGSTVTYDVVTGERVLTAAREFDTVLGTDLSPDLTTVVTGSSSRLVKLWRTEDASQIASIKKHTDWVTGVDFSPDGVLLATGGRGGGVWVWEAMTGNEFHTLRGHQAAITKVAFRADSNVLASASEDGSVRFWEMNGGREIRKIDAHRDGLLGFDWGRDGSFATAGRDLRVKLWKPDFSPRSTLDPLPDLPTALALDSEHGRVAVADYGGQIHLFDTQSGDRLTTFQTNPPELATRIEALDESIARLESERDQVSEAAGPQGEDETPPAKRRRELVARIDELRQQRRYWNRARFSSEAIALAREISAADSEAQVVAGQFTATANTIGDLADALARKRGHRHEFATALGHAGDDALRTEQLAVIDALDAVTADLKETLGHESETLLEKKAELDRLLPETERLRSREQTARAAYHAASETGD